jgi:hypothetical protein
VAEQLQRAEKAAALRKTRESLADAKKGLGNAFKKLRAPAARPLGFLKDRDGHVTSHPGELDKILRGAWHGIYEGNAQDHPQLVAAFLHAHREHLFVREPLTMPAITAERLGGSSPRRPPLRRPGTNGSMRSGRPSPTWPYSG